MDGNDTSIKKVGRTRRVMASIALVGSSSSCPGSSSAASTMARATRSLVEPVGFWPSSFA